MKVKYVEIKDAGNLHHSVGPVGTLSINEKFPGLEMEFGGAFGPHGVEVRFKGDVSLIPMSNIKLIKFVPEEK